MISFYYLVEDQFLNNVDSSASIAQVISMSNTVKTKKNYNYHWINTKGGDRLHIDDQIFTYDNSNAEIILEKGPKIVISPNTLISLSNIDNENTINVEKGIILANLSESKKKLKINIEGKELTLNSNKAKFQISKTSGNSRVDILEGSATFTIDNKEKKLNVGQQISLAKKAITIRDVNLHLLQPEMNQLFIKNDPITFKWNAKEKIHLEISKNINFRKIIKSIPSKANSTSIPLEEGNYYWRIKGNNETSIPRLIKVVPQTTVKIQSPKKDEIIITKNQSPKIHLDWTDKYFRSHIVQIIGPNYKISKVVNNNSLVISPLQLGSYKWTVTPNIKLQGIKSVRSEFSISRPFLPSRPRIVSPKKDSIITLFDKTNIDIRWGGSNKSEYELLISKDDSFNEILLSTNKSSNNTQWKPKSSGTFYYKVREIDPLGRETPFSKTTKFSVDLIDTTSFIPKAGSQIELNRPKEQVKFRWKRAVKINKVRPRYFLEISEESDFSKILISKESFINSNSVTFPNLGKYFWRTKVVYPNNKESFSKPQQVSVTPTPPPERPKTQDLEIEIKVNYLLDLIKEVFTNVIGIFIPSTQASEMNTSAVIKWEKSENAKNYILEIYKDKERIIHKTLKETSYEVTNIKEGEYYWRIAIVDFWDRQSDFSKLSTITFTLPDEYRTIPKPILINPKKKQRYTNKKSLVRFKWKKSKHASKYVILISKDEDFKNIYVKRTRTKNKLNIRLSQSKYYWKVIAYNQFEYSSESRKSFFHIKEKKKKKITKPKKKNSTKKTISSPKEITHKSSFHFQYDISSSDFSQEFTDYTIQAKDLVFTSFNIGNTHFLNNSSMIQTNIKRISGKVFDSLSYGVTSIESFYSKELFIKNFFIGLGASFNKFTSYQKENTNISDKENTSFSIPVSLKYLFQTENYIHDFNLSYSFGSLSLLSVAYSIQLWNPISLGLQYENHSSSLDNSDFNLNNIKASLRYSIYY